MGEPIKYEVKPVNGPGAPGQLFVRGKKADVKRVYSPSAAPNVPVLPTDTVWYDDNGLPVIARPLSSEPFYMPMSGLSRTAPQLVDTLNLTALLAHSGLSFAQSQQLTQTVSHNVQSSMVTVGSPIGQIIGYERVAPVTPFAEIAVGQMMIQSQMAALVAQSRLLSDAQNLERYNSSINELNARILPTLTRISGQDFGADPEAWEKWYTDLLGYAVQPQLASPEKPLLVEEIPFDVPMIAPVVLQAGPDTIAKVRHACFGRGTPVHTLDGLRPIESILPGDQVLSQDPGNGTLSFQPVLRAIHNPPNQTLRITLGEETIVATGIHRFWKAGQGWVMARDLKSGDPIRTSRGVVKVTAVKDEAVQPVFNLEVASGQSFLVGTQGALVHDNSLVETVSEPFDAPPVLAHPGVVAAE